MHQVDAALAIERVEPPNDVVGLAGGGDTAPRLAV